MAQVLRAGIASAPQRLPIHHWRILNALMACRTPAMGGHRYACKQCGLTHFAPHSCRNRHCPLCQGQAARDWLVKQEQSLLPVPYFHLVFTLPHALNPLIGQNQRRLFTLLFEAASQTLLEFGRNRFKAQLGVTAVLHTWSQTLMDHYHLHCIVTGGGLCDDGSRWVGSGSRYLFAVEALSKVFRAKFCAGLEKLHADGKLEFHGQLMPLSSPVSFKKLLRQALSRKWVVYAKQPFAGPQQVLAYLSRYTHRVAISSRRLLALDEKAKTVTFAWKDYADESKNKTMTLGLQEFLRRFCLHLLPERFVKIRHFGLLSNRQRQAKVGQVRALLRMVVASVVLAATPMKPSRTCPHCGSAQLVLIEIVRSRPTGPPQSLDTS